MTKTISPYNINQTRDMNKVKYKFGDNYRNFRPITRAADYPHWSIFVITREKISTDYPHWQITRTQKKENRWLTQSSFIVLVDMLSFSVQLLNFHTFVFAVSLRMIPIVKICSKKNWHHPIYWVGEIAWNGKILFTSR